MPIRIAAPISTATRGEIAANRGFDPVDDGSTKGGGGSSSTHAVAASVAGLVLAESAMD
jgi:hypothetical protein